MNKLMIESKCRRTSKRRVVKLFAILLTLTMVLSLSPTVTLAADFIGYGSGATTVLKVDRTSGFTYNFSGAASLPDEFGRVYYDSGEPLPYRVHGDQVNFYYTTGPGTGNRAVYCFEPDNPYLSENDPYDIYNDIPSHSQKASITQEQRDMLAYVMAEGETEYIDSTNEDQVATQLAIWMVGAGHYNDGWLEDLLPSSGGNPGIAPTQAICDKARELIATAMSCVLDRPSFANIGDVKMDWDGLTYSITFTDTNNELTNTSVWGVAILSKLQIPGFTAVIDDITHTLTITGDPGLTGTEISIILATTGKKADIVFMDDQITLPTTHTYYTSRQSMITINTLDAAVAGQFKLLRSTPTITTSARNADDGTQTVKPHRNVTITDTVSYSDLIPGREYTLNGVLMDKSTGAPLLVNGQEIRSSATFTPQLADGTTIMTFTLDAWTLSGKTLVVFEELFLAGVSIAKHDDIDDTDQSIEVLPEPRIATTAKNAANNTNTVSPRQTVTITDTVSYLDLTPGTEYTLEGILMDKSTGAPLLINGQEVRSSATFTSIQATGTVDMTFTLDTTALSGKTLVVFEELFLAGVSIAEHKDIDDADQSIFVLPETYDPPTPPKKDDKPDETPDEPTDVPKDKPTDELTDEPVNNTTDETPDEPERPYVPGGNNPDVPPLPTAPGNTLISDGEGWLELDENGVPRGRWEWDDEEGKWIFEEDIPLGSLPQTGDSDIPVYIFLFMGASLIGIGLTLRFGQRKRWHLY